jgi:xanthine/CO dehydrogenase XdhC/CoxF family maturation factor
MRQAGSFAPFATGGSSALKHWQELKHILERVTALGQAGRHAAVAVVTAIDGSAYRRPGAKLLIDDEGGFLGGVSGGCLEEDDVLLPPPKLLVCGAGDDARPMVTFATAVGFRVFVADHRPAYLTEARFPEACGLFLTRPEEATVELPRDRQTYVVLKNHSLERDTAWIRRFIATDVPYIGVLGPRVRTQKILAKLGVADGPDSARVFGPVGLDVGADGPEQVGLSIVAELLAVHSGRKPQHLRERIQAIHV